MRMMMTQPCFLQAQALSVQVLMLTRERLETLLMQIGLRLLVETARLIMLQQLLLPKPLAHGELFLQWQLLTMQHMIQVICYFIRQLVRPELLAMVIPLNLRRPLLLLPLIK